MTTNVINSVTRVYSTVETIPTYGLMQDDLNPIFDKWLDPYPYTMQNHTSASVIDKAYEIIILENEYLKLTIIPSLGGRLYSAVDKRNNKDFLYRNKVIRPRMIGTRGAWFSGGMEFNFPISHSPTTMDRVNCQTRTYDDGSASVIFGNIEQMSYMNWKVELRLYPGKASIEQNVSLYNPTPRENKFYFWTNTAVEYNKSLKLIYPFDWCINFDKNYVKWPYYKNMDCRNPSEISPAYETFGKLMVNNFFGMYNADNEYGLVHYANRKKLKGAKFFIWGNNQNAEAWNKSLTSDDSQYIEVQSGPFETQSVYKFLKPHQELNWSEYWYPVSGMGGFKHAEKEVVFNFEKVGQSLSFDLLAVEELKDCRLVLRVNSKTYVKEISLTPERAVNVTFDVNEAFGLHEIKFDLYCGSRHIVNIGEREEISDEYPDIELYEDSRVGTFNDDKHRTLKQGQWRESYGLTAEAFDYYLKNLEVHPNCTITLNRLGNLYLKRMQYKQAEECFRKVLAYDNRNSQARFYLAVTEKEQGNVQRARRLLMDIAADAEYYQASVIELIKIDLQFGYYQEAQLLSELIDRTNYGRFLTSIAYRKDGLFEGARICLIGAETNSDEYMLAEKYLMDQSKGSKDQLVSFTAGDEKSLLPIALDYLDMGFLEDGETILKLIADPSLKTKLARAYIGMKQGNTNGEMVAVIQEASLDYMFFRKEHHLLKALLQLAEKDGSGKADYLLGTFYYAVNRAEDALEQYNCAYNKGLRYTGLLHNLGYIYFNYKKDMQQAEKYFTQDIAENKGMNEDSLVYLDRIYSEIGSLERRAALIPHMEKAKNKSWVLIPLINILRDAGEEEKALNLLENEQFENWEGKETSGPCYRDFILHMVKKELDKGDYESAKQWIERVRLYPANLNYGEGSDMYLSDIHYYTGMIQAGLGHEASAIDAFRKGTHELYKDPERIPDKNKRFGEKCLDELQIRELLS